MKKSRSLHIKKVEEQCCGVKVSSPATVIYSVRFPLCVRSLYLGCAQSCFSPQVCVEMPLWVTVLREPSQEASAPAPTCN